jgi:ferredoxin
MIVAEQKPFEQIFDQVKEHHTLLVLGCGTCVTVCMAGGEREVGILSNQLRLAAQQQQVDLEVWEHTITRQCDGEFFDPGVTEKIKKADAVLSVGCGVGVQHIVELFPDVMVHPGLNTRFYGANLEQGVWAERCAGCGECVLDQYEGICPVARCSKSLLNGPCGGSSEGMCEVDPENTPCAWQLIYDRMKKLNRLEKLMEYQSPKDWSKDHHGGPGRIIREDMTLE